MGKKRPWSYTAGRHGHKVRVYERPGRASIYVSVWEDGREVKRSLKHSDRERAMEYADDLSKELRKGGKKVSSGRPTVGRILQPYKAHRTPDKGEASRRADARHAALWTEVLGTGFDLTTLSRRQWDAFVRERRSGAINARGKRVSAKKRRPVRDRVVEKDCAWLRAVCRWATEFRDEHDQMLLERDPTRGLEIPKERNPARPVATHD